MEKPYIWLTQDEAANYLGISKPKIYRLVVDGYMTAVKFSPKSDMKFLKADLDAYVQKCRVNPEAGAEMQINQKQEEAEHFPGSSAELNSIKALNEKWVKANFE